MTEEQERLVLDNINLIYMVLKKYKIYSKIDEYYDVAMIGLCKGAKSFDKTRGFSESTYLSRCIANEILMTFRNKKINTIPLNSRCNTQDIDNTMCLDEVIPDEKINIENEIITGYEMELLHKNIKSLNPKYRFVIENIYFSDIKMTQKEIAEKIGVTQAQVSRIKKNAIEELKEKLKND